ncbi:MULTISPECIES: bifunctional orotidine-5'-phosphate decarboxylase/orotate phosphoribosyltransferase [unclassified Coleofasciculus]|uniref:bifunctional orotidine-5'-phosphate decarboxylase/orotate phosphoribosyltransferase n=1 Tax=unclassified Coleofasciculus TaxID=2692782 RepID=UPI00187FDFEA|nr:MULTISPECIES: bifunctional orotidine-5'-phosphate decarboxylase/orotate phosphoribosyltransferase [unclassified Coleofasciculus]MBE9130059.1 bifunctional orotidine-5'-phosphate decarboxylase/orotate phosphoribosyltransferase [Coleofasciculus sp. LEGE 07081]MBE9152404.1 bifunctional orotidine-5'-phosphate decarboxylase/orotate phosphoribosyltransferase [Coleofasciculus sp. LEGE 07092]
MNFFEKLNAAIAQNQSLLVVGLDPNPEMMPTRYTTRGSQGSSIEDLGDWLQFIIAQTAELVCAYKPTFGFYKALGVPGLELLERTLEAIPPHLPIILDAKHGDLNTSSVFAQMVFEQWQVDAITVSSYTGQDQVAPFLLYPGKAVFVLCCTSNPSAVAVQQYPTPETPLYLQVVKEAKTWGTPEELALEVGTPSPNILAGIRAVAPERVILVRSIWAEGSGDFKQMLTAGLNDSGEALLIPVPQDMLASEQPAVAIQPLREQINQTRREIIRNASACDLWMPDVCLLGENPHQDLILQLYDIGCILFGEFVQSSGAVFPYYIDLRKIISNPQLFHQMLKAYADILKDLSFDRIAGIPYGSLPTATGLSLRLNHPMIYPRKEVKAHGTRRVIEGHFELGETVVVVDDILISGKSAMEGAAKLESAGLTVNDIVVFIDHEQEVKDRLKANGYRAHSVLTISEITETLYQAGRIREAQYQVLAQA